MAKQVNWEAYVQVAPNRRVIQQTSAINQLVAKQIFEGQYGKGSVKSAVVRVK